jgi:transposase
MIKKYINEYAWSKIFSFLIVCKGIYIKGEESCRLFIEAVCWIARTGAQWRELPEKYGNWNSVYARFNDWSKKGIWEQLMAACIIDPDLEYIMFDATFVRAHACAAGYGDQEAEGFGRSKGGFTTKIHALVDALGNPLRFIITAGNRNDITQAEALIDGINGTHGIGDKAYDCDALRDKMERQNCADCIPSKSNRKVPYEYDKEIYKERHVIECFFSKIKYFRRIFSRFDKSARNFNSFLSFVGACIWLR